MQAGREQTGELSVLVLECGRRRHNRHDGGEGELLRDAVHDDTIIPTGGLVGALSKELNMPTMRMNVFGDSDDGRFICRLHTRLIRLPAPVDKGNAERMWGALCCWWLWTRHAPSEIWCLLVCNAERIKQMRA